MLIEGNNSIESFKSGFEDSSDVLFFNKDDTFDLKFDKTNLRIKTDKGTWITSTEITANSVSINFTDGGSLRIEGTANVTYQLADGSKYSTNHERLEWDSK